MGQKHFATDDNKEWRPGSVKPGRLKWGLSELEFAGDLDDSRGIRLKTHVHEPRRGVEGVDAVGVLMVGVVENVEEIAAQEQLVALFEGERLAK
jgi:hypothetical protein